MTELIDDSQEFDPTTRATQLWESLGHDVDPTRPDDLIVAGEMTYGDKSYIVTVGQNSAVVDQIVAKAREPQMQSMVPKDQRERFANKDTFQAWYEKGRFLVTFWDPENGEVAVIDWYGESSFQKELTKLSAAADKHRGEDAETRIPELDVEGAEIDFVAPDKSDDTFAIRAYQGYTGMPRPEGEDSSFPRKSMDVSAALYVLDQVSKGRNMEGQLCWLETNLFKKDTEELNTSVYLYRNAGYKEIGEDEGRYSRYMNPVPSNVEWRIAMVKSLSPSDVMQNLDKIDLIDAA